MSGVYITGFNWSDIKALAELSNTKLNRTMLKKLCKIEELVIKEDGEAHEHSGN